MNNLLLSNGQIDQQCEMYPLTVSWICTMHCARYKTRALQLTFWFSITILYTIIPNELYSVGLPRFDAWRNHIGFIGPLKQSCKLFSTLPKFNLSYKPQRLWQMNSKRCSTKAAGQRRIISNIENNGEKKQRQFNTKCVIFLCQCSRHYRKKNNV